MSFESYLTGAGGHRYIRATLLSDKVRSTKMPATETGVKVVGPGDGAMGFLGSIGVRFMIDGDEAAERFSLVEHPMSARALAAPIHRHTREDEYSFVLEGRMGALLGDEFVEAGPGDLVHKPRDQWHTFWNAGDEPCRILEIISPAGFERFFAELDALGGVKGDPEAVAALSQRYGLEMRPETVPELIERFGVRIGEPLPGGWRP
jgi:mannose-6-phosphate isomerase-like protein (cupin superfamily)